MHTYLACFDISDDRSRRKVGLLLERYGLRVQRSVFEIAVDSPEQLQRLQTKLRRYLAAEDDMRFYHLCVQCRTQSFDQAGERVAQYPVWMVI